MRFQDGHDRTLAVIEVVVWFLFAALRTVLFVCRALLGSVDTCKELESLGLKLLSYM